MPAFSALIAGQDIEAQSPAMKRQRPPISGPTTLV